MNEFVDNPDYGVASVQQGVGTWRVRLFVHVNKVNKPICKVTTSLPLLLYMPLRHNKL